LLDNFEFASILQEIEDTLELLEAESHISDQLKKALHTRLEHRAAFLRTVEVADSRSATNIKDMWACLLDISAEVKVTACLGKAVPDCFSVKIQRKLASTVPPRPVIEVSQDAAFNHLEQICRDATVAVDVLKYHDSQSLLVSNAPQHQVRVLTSS